MIEGSVVVGECNFLVPQKLERKKRAHTFKIKPYTYFHQKKTFSLCVEISVALFKKSDSFVINKSLSSSSIKNSFAEGQFLTIHSKKNVTCRDAPFIRAKKIRIFITIVYMPRLVIDAKETHGEGVIHPVLDSRRLRGDPFPYTTRVIEKLVLVKTSRVK